ncbi:MAG: adenylate/guanylate cyclase domain-containing protein [Microscillaceae bacterium]|nr:adenylate/guanylate cyclase domain-containing protein [Microscillaceae bacterium]
MIRSDVRVSKKTFFIFLLWLGVLFLTNALVCPAQNQETDALKKALDNKQLFVEDRLATLLQISQSLSESKPTEALSYAKQAEKLAQDTHNRQGLATSYTIQGYIQAFHFNEPLEAYTYHEQAYQIYKSLYEGNQMGKWELYSFLEDYAIPTYKVVLEKNAKKRKYRKAIEKYNQLNSEFLDYLTKLTYDTKEDLSQTQNKLDKIDSQLQDVDRKLGEKNTELNKKSIELHKKNLSEKKLILDKLKLSGDLEEKEIEALALSDSLLISELELQSKALKLTREKARNEMLAKEKVLQQAEIGRQRMMNATLSLGIAAVILVLVLIWHSLRVQRKANRLLKLKSQEILQQKEEIETQRDNIERQNVELQQQKEEIEAQRDNIEQQNAELHQQKEEIEAQRDNIEFQSREIKAQRDNLLLMNQTLNKERSKSETLLLNILPEEVAHELKENGYATPKHYDLVSVLFTDFKGFTGIAEQLTPSQLVKELNYCFQAFDEIIAKYELEKIKTIGDAYMCAGGLPVPNRTNPIDAVKAGLAMQEFMEEYNTEKIAKGQPVFELRVGIHTGPLVAGVIGKNKFAYDIWGDTVNLASRMESGGEIGKVNISATTYELVKSYFNCVHRGKIQAKNKGEIDMYFVQKRSSLFQGIQNITNSPIQIAS